MYGDYFNNKFNGGFNEGECDCPDCQGYTQEGIDVEETFADIEIQDPQDIIDGHFELVLQANDEEEIYTYLTSLFYNGYINGQKQELFDDIQVKIDMLNELQNGSK